MKPADPRVPDDSAPPAVDVPDYRPLERFWPYVELSEQPTDEELASLDPELVGSALRYAAAAVLRVVAVSDVRRAGLCPRAGARPRVSRVSRDRQRGGLAASRALLSADALRLRTLFEIVGRLDACEVLIDDRPLPYARELWLPLMWFLIS